jgi:hypothetical protein
MKLNRIFLVIIALLITSIACKHKATYYNGESMANYPDMELIWKENFEHFDRGLETYKLVTIDNNKKDTTFVHPDNIDWNNWKGPLVTTNIHKKEFDKQYKIDMFSDTLSNSMTILYSSLNLQNPTNNVSIVSNGLDNSISSVFVNYIDAGFFSSTSYKLLYVNGVSIQVQETIKKPFSKLKKRIRTLYFN